MTTALTVAACQMTPRRRELAANRHRILRLARKTKADVVLFPELATTGYYFVDRFELFGLAEDPVNSPFLDELAEIAAESNRLICLGLPERTEDGGLFNSSVSVLPDGRRIWYRKIHLFYREKEVFTPGDRSFPVFDWRGVGYGMMICYDWRFPESARSLKLAGADLVLHPSNLVAPTDLWWPVMSCRAFENRIFIATANRSGAETLDGETLSFSGGSRIVDVSGRILAEASPDEDGAIFSTIDPNRARRTMFNRFNDILDDRRPALYRYDAVESLDDDTLSTDPDGRDS